MKKDDCVEIYDISKQPIVSNDLDLLIIGGPIYAYKGIAKYVDIFKEWLSNLNKI